MAHRKAPNSSQCVIYARYSSQAQRDQSIEDQVSICNRWASSHGLDVYEVYADRHISGTTDDRPAFQQMIQDAAEGHWATVVVYKVDRFARDKTDAAVYRRKLKQLGVKVESAMESIPDGPEGIILEGMLDAFAEYYSRNLSQNIKRGMMSNAEKCMTNGVTVLGYRTAPDGTYEIDPDKAPIVQELFTKRAAGEDLESLAKWLASAGVHTSKNRVPSIHYVRKRLNDSRYLGIYKFSDVEVPGGIPRIIDDELWAATRSQRYRRTDDGQYALQGRVFDLASGQPYSCEYGTSATDRRYYYYVLKQKGERTYRVAAQTLEGTVAHIVQDALSDQGLAHKIAVDAVAVATEQANSPIIKNARTRLPQIERELSRLVDSIAAGVPLDLVQPKIADLESERKECEIVISESEVTIPTVDQLEHTIKTKLTECAKNYDDLCCTISEVYIDRSEGTVTITLPWGDNKSKTIQKESRTRRYIASSTNCCWWSTCNVNRTMVILPLDDCVLLRASAPWVA